MIVFENCSSYSIYEIQIDISENPNKNLESKSLLHLGISLVDITPPPGMPLAGYSLNAVSSKGFRHKLKARIFLLRNSKNKTIIIIQSDLLSGSKIVRHRVAEIISKTYPISFHSITFFGTHTHAGPGNYFESNFYNFYAANRSGFDNQYFEFLVSQLVKGIEEAWYQQIPVQIAFGKKKIYGYTKNRSLEAFKKNPNIPKTITELQAIQPDLYLIRFDSLENIPIAALSNFSIHPTVIPESNFFYHRDVFGYIEKGLEDLVKEKYKIKNFIHSALNYTHGDITPNYDDKKEKGDFIIAKEIGYGISREIFELFNSLENQFIKDIELNALGKEIDLFQENKIEEVEICNYPIVGLSLTTGATTRSTPILKYLPFFRPGWPRWFFTKSCQGEKRWYLSKIHNIFLPKEDFPHELYFQAIQIGKWIYLPYPFEITFESGRIIQEQINKEYPEFEIIPVSCANGYTGYTTTPYEYSLQYYEGGHTLYGKNSTLFLAKVGKILTKKLFENYSDDQIVAPKIKKFLKLKSKSFYPKPSHSILLKREEKEPPKFVFKEKESYWYFRYWDVPMYLIEFHKPLILLEKNEFCQSDYKEFLSEESLDLSFHYVKNQEDKSLYEVRWYISTKEIDRFKDHCYRFKIFPRSVFDDFYSSEFSWKN